MTASVHALRPESASLWAPETPSGQPQLERGLLEDGLLEQAPAKPARHIARPTHLVDSDVVVAW